MAEIEEPERDVPRILLLFVHPFPHRSRVNLRLLDGVRDLPGVEVCDLYEHYPDFHIDIEMEQQNLREIDLLVVQHPIYWYSAPAILKQWQDTVLEYGFAFGSGGNALRGKDWLSVVSAGQHSDSYHRDGHNRRSVAELLYPYECSANHCGMRYMEPIVVHNAHQVSDGELEVLVGNYRRRLIDYRPSRMNIDG